MLDPLTTNTESFISSRKEEKALLFYIILLKISNLIRQLPSNNKAGKK